MPGINDKATVTDEITVSVGRGCPIEDGLKITGHVLVELRDEFGNLKEKREIHNLVVTRGKQHIADQLSSAPNDAAMGWMAIGTGAVAPAITDTLLGAEIDRNALTSRTDSGAVITYVGDWAAGDGTNAAITEAGIFGVVTANTIPMLARATFTLINKGASDTLKITWAITVS